MSLPKGAINRQINNHDIAKTPFVMFQAHQDDYYKLSKQAVNNINHESMLSRVFFSPANTNIINRRIVKEILQNTNGEYLIEPQNVEDLRLVQQYVFSQHAKNSPDNIKQQVGELNDIVVAEIIPDIISNLQSYFRYLKDAFGQTQVMDRPENVSNAGRKLLPSVTKRFE